jgi:hypothetical protein
MKKIIVMTTLCLGLSSVYAQKIKEADVPAAVKEGFKNSFPNSKAKEWEKEDDNFEAEFDVKKVETSALFDANGSLLQTEVEIAVKELPKAIIDYLSKNETGKKIKEAAKITDNKGVISYEAEVTEADYIFESAGNYIKKEVEKDDKDEE